jgi:hypothetical protein
METNCRWIHCNRRYKQGLLLYVVDECTLFSIFSILLRVLGKLAHQDIVKLFERNCFNILSFRMKYFDHVPCGSTCNSIGWILNPLLEFLVKVYSDYWWFDENGCELQHSCIWTGPNLIVIVAMPIFGLFTRIFQKKMQVAFEEVHHWVPIWTPLLGTR